MAKTETMAQVVKQELRDFKDEVLSDLKEIKEQVEKTNGYVADNKLSINIVREKQDTCQARKFFTDEYTKRDWTDKAITLAIGLLGAIIGFFGSHFI